MSVFHGFRNFSENFNNIADKMHMHNEIKKNEKSSSKNFRQTSEKSLSSKILTESSDGISQRILISGKSCFCSAKVA